VGRPPTPLRPPHQSGILAVARPASLARRQFARVDTHDGLDQAVSFPSSGRFFHDSGEQNAAVPDEWELVQGARRGDRACFGALYDRYYRRVYAYAYYRADGNAAAAEDVTQEVFLRALRAIERFRWQDASFLAWLLTIARNLLTDQARRPAPVPLDGHEDDLTADPVAAAEGNLARREVAAALARLTPDQREAIILRFLEGLSIAETSRIMGKTEDAVKRLQARGLAALRRLLQAGAPLRG